jgi:hypothetical protein
LVNKETVRNRVNFKAATIIFGVMVALIVLFTMWFKQNSSFPVAEIQRKSFKLPFNLKASARTVVELIF